MGIVLVEGALYEEGSCWNISKFAQVDIMRSSFTGTSARSPFLGIESRLMLLRRVSRTYEAGMRQSSTVIFINVARVGMDSILGTLNLRDGGSLERFIVGCVEASPTTWSSGRLDLKR